MAGQRELWNRPARSDIVVAMHVFTYGTLMFPEIWQAVVGQSFETVEASAAGFEVFRVRDAAFPGIVAGNSTCSVIGGASLNVGQESAERLDRFEDDFYERRPIAGDCSDGQRRL